MAVQRLWMVRSAALRRCAFSLEKVCSTGLRSSLKAARQVEAFSVNADRAMRSVELRAERGVPRAAPPAPPPRYSPPWPALSTPR